MSQLTKFYRAVFLVWFACLASDAFAQKIEQTELPERFFRWTYRENLSKSEVLGSLRKSGTLPLSPISQGFAVGMYVPYLNGRPATFTWTHPITGMAFNSMESYGDTLVMMETVRQPVRVMTLETGGHNPFFSGKNVKWANVDVIHHLNYKNDQKLFIEEWIILNPAVISHFTADPEVILPIIEPEIKRLRKGTTYTAEELHSKMPGQSDTKPFFNTEKHVKGYVLPILKDYAALRSADIPIEWRPPRLADEANAARGSCGKMARALKGTR